MLYTQLKKSQFGHYTASDSLFVLGHIIYNILKKEKKHRHNYPCVQMSLAFSVLEWKIVQENKN